MKARCGCLGEVLEERGEGDMRKGISICSISPEKEGVVGQG